MSRPDWMGQAACTRHDPDLWHPDQDRTAARKAKQICYSCPVIRDCDTYIHTIPAVHRHGIWAGKHWT